MSKRGDEALKRVAEAFYSGTHAYHDEHPDPPFDAAYRDAQLRQGALAFIRSLEADGWACIQSEILDQFPEINMGNYDDTDVYHLNSWGVEIVTAPRLTGDER